MNQCRKDSCHGLPPMTGGGDPVRGSVKAADDRRGPFLPGASEGRVHHKECGEEMALG